MSSDQDTLEQGATIGCYQVEEVLGRGGFAVTYLAIDRNLDVYVAIKEYLPREITTRNAAGEVQPRDTEFADDYNIGLENFAREAKTLALFKHPNIVRVHQVLHQNNTAYIVMDYEHGQELAEVLEDRKSLPEEELRPILMPVLDAVSEIHRQGYVHRDIKPSNIYLRDNGSPVLLDFGAARYTMSETTQQLTAVVTVGYTPIEQYNVSDVDQGPWTDIYAMSAVLYEAVTGEMPVDSVTRASTALTNAADPLVSIRDKALHTCTDHFCNAVDWGLRMDAIERPRTVDQWLAALNNLPLQPEVTETDNQPDVPAHAAKPSKLRTRAKTLAATELDANRRSSVEMAIDGVDIDLFPDTRIEPSFSESLESIEVDARPELPTNPRPKPHTNQGHERDSRNGLATRHELSPEAPRELAPGRLNTIQSTGQPTRQPPSMAPNALGERQHLPELQSLKQQPRDRQAPGHKNDAATNALTQQAAGPAEGKTHTQRIRDVVRRDIMKRDVDVENTTDNAAISRPALNDNTVAADTPRSSPPGPGTPPSTPRRPGRILTRGSIDGNISAASVPGVGVSAVSDAPDDLRSRHDSIQIDDTDWDYEPPYRPSRWKWIVPATGLAGVFAASLLYVNRPDLFQFSRPDIPELTIESALERAQDKTAAGDLIFPAGESALDYYQLVLGTEPNNVEALAGVDLIEREVRETIVQNVENNSLAEANRLLSRANKAGLRVDNIPSTNGSQYSADRPSDSAADRVTAIDKDLSPYLKGQIAKIEQQIESGDAEGANALLAQADRFLPDANLSSSLRQRIDALQGATEGNDSAVPSVLPEDGLLSTTSAATTGTAEQLASERAPTATVPEITTDTNSSGGSNSGGSLVPNAEILARANINSTNSTADSGTLSATESEPSARPDNNRPTTSRPVSAPRKSYIDGSGDSARHLNQLRQAIEAKNISRVLQVSNGLPSERVDFLNRMFQRYDRLDVVIDRISNQSGKLTANLNVSMFNRRNDGTYYSAGRWNGVTVRASKTDDQWQKIDW